MKAVILRNETDLLHRKPIVKQTDEHVIPDGLGAGFTVRGAIDLKTNNELGQKIDQDLVSQLAPFRSALGLKTSRDKEIALTSADGGLQLVGDKPCFVSPKGPPWSVIKTNGQITGLHLEAKTIEQAQQMIPHMLAAHGLSPGALKDVQVTRVRENVGRMTIPTGFGAGGFFRSIAKSSFLALSRHAPVDVLLDTSFDPLRSYILDGAEHYPNANLCCWDYRFGTTAFSAKHSTAEIFHEIALRCDPRTGIGASVVTLFGCLRASCLLTTAWKGPDLSKCMIVDLQLPADRHRETDEQFPAINNLGKDTWLAHAGDLHIMEGAISRVLALFDDIRRKRYFDARMLEVRALGERVERGEISAEQFTDQIQALIRSLQIDLGPGGASEHIPLPVTLADLLKRKDD